jgi:pterin-4a-carbinolamine dehydratase
MDPWTSRATGIGFVLLIVLMQPPRVSGFLHGGVPAFCALATSGARPAALSGGFSALAGKGISSRGEFVAGLRSRNQQRIPTARSYMRVSKLDDAQRKDVLQNLLDSAGWGMVDGRDAIKKSFEFGNFITAFGFMSRVALHAEKADHHPEWCASFRTILAWNSLSRSYLHLAPPMPWWKWSLRVRIVSVAAACKKILLSHTALCHSLVHRKPGTHSRSHLFSARK